MSDNEFSKETRDRIAERCGGMCEYCHKAPAANYHHRKYRSRGGTGNVENGIALCGSGNHTGCHGLAHSATPPYGLSLHSYEDESQPFIDIYGFHYWLTPDGLRLTVRQYEAWKKTRKVNNNGE